MSCGRWLQDQLSAHKLPRYIDFCRESLPMTESGKIGKAELSRGERDDASARYDVFATADEVRRRPDERRPVSG